MRLAPVALLGLAFALAGCDESGSRSPAAGPFTETACGTYDGNGCSPTAKRVDTERPSFSHPTEITNPLFPISRLRSAVLLGHVDGKPFRTETTLLPGTQAVEWDGRRINVLVSQYTAYLDGRLAEVALDRYAQADDGSVWYLGEDVYDYEHGTVALTEGTWLAGRDGPAAMIMPAEPNLGAVFRPENAIGIVFEEVTVKAAGKTVDGPRGPVRGAIVTRELHADGGTEDKVFAPGYGEFSTGSAEGDLEALALAVPIDALPGPEPKELRFLHASATGLVELVRLGDWEAAADVTKRMAAAWQTLEMRPQPPMIAERLSANTAALQRAVVDEKPLVSAQKAIDVAQSVLDLELRHKPRTRIDVERFHLWTQQLRLDAKRDDGRRVAGSVAVLEWIRDRITPLLGPVDQAEVNDALRALRTASDARNLPAAADHAARIGARVRTLSGS